MRYRSATLLVITGVSMAIVLLAGCAALDSVLEDALKKPRVSFESAELTGLSFTDADLMFTLEIENPNALGIHMAGFDYDFQIDGSSFISGDINDRLDIDANDTSMVELPIHVTYEDLFKSFEHLFDRDSSTYRIECGFSFDIPVIGTVVVPVSNEGELPVLRLPNIRFGRLKLKKLTLTEARLEMDLHLKNQNAFALNLSSFNYDLHVNGNRWADGDLEIQTDVGEHDEGLIRIPLNLDLLQIGISAYNILKDKKPVTYGIKGDYRFSTSLPLIDEVGEDFILTGSIKIAR